MVVASPLSEWKQRVHQSMLYIYNCGMYNSGNLTLRQYGGLRVCNDHEVDQNLETDFFADFPTELPTMATMVTMLAVLGYGYILTDDQ